MKKVKLSEGLSLSAVVQGFWRLDSWKWSAVELARFMNECIDRGVTTFDTAEIYGGTLCETLMGPLNRIAPFETKSSWYRKPVFSKRADLDIMTQDTTG